MIRRCSLLRLQPSLMNSDASQSRSSGWVGFSPTRPKLSTERTSPVPKCQRQTRLTNTRNITADEAVNKFFLSEYVRNREGWNGASAKEMQNKVLSLSIAQEQEKFAAQRRPQNPNSPVANYQGGEIVSAAVRNITFINDRVAQVRFVRSVMRPGNAPDETSNWIATVNFKYVDRPTTEAGRLDNPLGFQVVSYRADPEIAR